MKSLNRKYMAIIILTALSGFCAVAANAQNWQRMGNPKAGRATKAARQAASVRSSQYPTRTINNSSNNGSYINTSQATRGSINYPTTPTVENSFYPTVRQSAPEFNSYGEQQSGWSDLGANTKIRSGYGLSSAPSEDSNTLSPEVLETIRQLKAEYAEPEPMYQMAAPAAQPAATGSTSSPKGLSPKQPNGLISPKNSGNNSSKNQNKTTIDIEGSTLTFPPGKNIKIKSLDFRQTPVSDALRSLARIININLMLSSEIPAKTVTVLFSDVTMEEAFNTILINFNLSFSWEGKILRIFPSELAPTFTRIFTIQHTNAGDLQAMIERLLSERGKLELDARTNAIIVTDTLAKLTELENMLPQIDVKETGLEITSRPVTEVFYLNYADANSIEPAIQMISENVKINKYSSSAASQAGAAADSSGGGAGRLDMMIITDTLTNLDRIRELIDKLDVAPIQVTIDAHIYEIDKNKETQIGVNWQKLIPVEGTSDANLLDINISPTSSTAGGTGVFRFGSLSMNQFQVVLSTLNTNSFAKVLSNPVITTLNNHTANISVGQAISYISASTVSEGGQVSNTVETANANIELNVTPSVTGNDEVFLDIKPKISNVLGYTTLGGNSTPNLSNREATTQVICKNNHTIVIGGMMKTDKSNTINKVPILGSLPGIGKLFQSKSEKEITTELIIFITPHIVREKAAKHNSSVLSAQHHY